ncbi:MAG TPA: MFS transporter [Tepidisphaeraceae bacterium]|jgi:MFS family permease|nr:MFS transporter [Tepidisphaeraceae bacterium]
MNSAPSFRNHLTLVLCTILHAFTHAYGTLLVPLYLLIVADLKLGGIWKASIIVTIYGFVYCLFSYPAGVMADRFNRKALLGIGLLGNALAITAIGLTRQYEMLIALGVLGGLFGTLFHPAANALVPAHYPKSPGMAIGILGMGSGLGFFVGPQYAGWRAQSASWNFGAVANWQKPCIEMGLAGIIGGIIFLLIAKEVRGGSQHSHETHPPLGRSLRRRVMALAGILCMRDFAGVAVLSLASIFLQKAHAYTVKQAGFVVGGMMLLSFFANPIAVYLSPGKRRLPTLIVILITGGLIIATTTFWNVRFILPVLCAFQTLQLGSYAVSDAAILERVHPSHRGRVVGLFLTIAGTFSALAPWAMGFWTDLLHDRATQPSAYAPIFAVLGAMMLISSLCTPLINKLGQITGPAIDPLSEARPRTMEVVG